MKIFLKILLEALILLSFSTQSFAGKGGSKEIQPAKIKLNKFEKKIKKQKILIKVGINTLAGRLQSFMNFEQISTPLSRESFFVVAMSIVHNIYEPIVTFNSRSEDLPAYLKYKDLMKAHQDLYMRASKSIALSYSFANVRSKALAFANDTFEKARKAGASLDEAYKLADQALMLAMLGYFNTYMFQNIYPIVFSENFKIAPESNLVQNEEIAVIFFRNSFPDSSDLDLFFPLLEVFTGGPFWISYEEQAITVLGSVNGHSTISTSTNPNLFTILPNDVLRIVILYLIDLQVHAYSQ